jgi:hypothetical protein
MIGAIADEVGERTLDQLQHLAVELGLSALHVQVDPLHMPVRHLRQVAGLGPCDTARDDGLVVIIPGPTRPPGGDGPSGRLRAGALLAMLKPRRSHPTRAPQLTRRRSLSVALPARRRPLPVSGPAFRASKPSVSSSVLSSVSDVAHSDRHGSLAPQREVDLVGFQLSDGPTHRSWRDTDQSNETLNRACHSYCAERQGNRRYKVLRSETAIGERQV